MAGNNAKQLNSPSAFPKWKILILVICSLAIFVFMIALIRQFQYNQPRKEQENRTLQLASQLNQYITKMREITIRISNNRYVTERLSKNPNISENAEENRNAMVALDSIKVVTQGAIVYVMNKDSLVILSTPYDQHNHTLIGKRYELHPNFKETLNGNHCIYAARGNTTQQRGLYFSSPVLGDGNKKPVGVIVIKIGMEALDQIIGEYLHPAAIMSKDGIIFSTNHHQWLFKSALPFTKKKLAHLKQLQEYTDETLSPLPFTENENKICIGEDILNISKKKILIPGWSVFTAENFDSLKPTPWEIPVGLIIILISYLIGLNMVSSQKKRKLEVEKNAAKKEILHQNEFLMTILDSLAYPLYIINLSDHSVALANKIARNAAENHDDHPVCYALSHGKDRFCYQTESGNICPADIIKKERKPIILEHVHRSPDGKEKYLEIHAYPIIDSEGNLDQMIEYVVDITSRKKMEEESIKGRQLESIGILAGGIAHDFNNLLSVIIGNITLVKDDLPPREKNFTFLSHAEDSAIKAAELAQKLTSFSRGGWLDKETICLGRLIRDLVKSNPINMNFSISYDLDIEDDLLQVNADRNRLNQVISNILKNAAESISDNPKEVNSIRIEAQNVIMPEMEIPGYENLPHQKNYSYVRISIIDKGKGIPKSIIGKVFDPYFSTKNAGNQKGMGLGLTLCYSIIKKHEGYISLLSEEEKGTQVNIFIPGIATPEM